MVEYKSRFDTEAVVRLSDNMVIGPDNIEAWSEYQAWRDQGNTPLPPDPLDTYVPNIISDRQFFQQAAIIQLITQAEALAAVKTGAIPPLLQNIVDQIQDPNQKFAATMLLSGATSFERNHPFTDSVASALGWSKQQVDQFFIEASNL